MSLVQSTDPSRLVDTDSGGGANNYGLADVFDIHTYPYPGTPEPLSSQYGAIGEFGGLGAFIKGKEWVADKCYAYLTVGTPQKEADTYASMAASIVKNRQHVSASVYTQITDVELECDGFLNYDRTAKFDAAQMATVVAANQALINSNSE